MKSTTKTEPWAKAQPYIMGAGDALQNTYNSVAPGLADATNSVTGLIPSMVQKYQQGNAGVNAAQDYNVGVLGGKYLDQGNPYLQSIIDQSGNDLRNQMQAAMGVRGQSGGSQYADIASRNLSNNAMNLRYNDYNNERTRMATAAGQSPGLASADYLSVMPMLSTLQASTMPLDAASQYAGSLGGLFGQYNKTTQKQGALGSLMQLAGQGLQAYATGGLG